MKKERGLIILFVLISLIGLSLIQTGIPPPLDPDMLVYLKMNNDSRYGENDSFIYDFSGNVNDALNLNGAVWTSDGLVGGGYSFARSKSDWIYIPHDESFNFNSTENFSISFCFKNLSCDTKQPQYSCKIIQKGDWVEEPMPFSFRLINGSRKMAFLIKADYLVGEESLIRTALPVTNPTWACVIGTNEYPTSEHPENHTISLYYYNASDSWSRNVSADAGDSLNTENLYIGGNTQLGRNLSGTLDEIIIWNRTLTLAEGQALWDNYSIPAVSLMDPSEKSQDIEL